MLDGWLNSAMKRRGIGQAELARQLTESLGRSIDRAAINKALKGERKLGADEMLSVSQITGEPLPGLASVPVVSWVSAGRLADAQSQIPVEDARPLVLADLGDGDFFALQVKGDSMDRLSPENSIIVVNRRERELIPGKAFIFAVRGDTTYKLWRPDPDRLEPYSTNPANQSIFIRRARDMAVIGRVRRTVLDL